MKHQSHIEHYELEDLAVKIGDLRYDSLALFLELLSKKIALDASKDGARGRSKLAESLNACSDKLAGSSEDIARAWIICKPYMKDYQ